MDWSQRVNAALDYIEQNLEYNIDIAKAASKALCSPNRFADIFLATTGLQVSEYIRRRRLSLAAVELQAGEEKIIDIALKYGYASPTAFNRAFQKQHKVSPQYARSRRVPLLTYPRLSLQIILKGEIHVKVRIEEKPAFTVVGVKKRFCNDVEVKQGELEPIPAFWASISKETYAQLAELTNTSTKGLVGMCADFDGIREFDYYIAAATTKPTPKGLHRYDIPAATWVILENDGQKFWDLHQRFFKEWLPSSGYHRADASIIPDIEVYSGIPEDDSYVELWFPIVKDS